MSRGFSQREKKSGENGRSSQYSIVGGSLLFLAAEERGVSGIAIFIVGALGALVCTGIVRVRIVT